MPRAKSGPPVFPEVKPTEEQINLALQREFGVKPAEDHHRRWNIPVGLRFEIPGPVIVHADTENTSEVDHDDLGITVRLAGLTLKMGWAGAEAVAFALLGELYGDDWARILMALTRRCPVDYEDQNSIPEAAAQALWRAAYSYREHWPCSTRELDDRIWGCAAPEGFTPVLPSGNAF